MYLTPCSFFFSHANNRLSLYDTGAISIYIIRYVIIKVWAQTTHCGNNLKKRFRGSGYDYWFHQLLHIINYKCTYVFLVAEYLYVNSWQIRK